MPATPQAGDWLVASGYGSQSSLLSDQVGKLCVTSVGHKACEQPSCITVTSHKDKAGLAELEAPGITRDTQVNRSQVPNASPRTPRAFNPTSMQSKQPRDWGY